jgi:hypothetical protein
LPFKFNLQRYTTGVHGTVVVDVSVGPGAGEGTAWVGGGCTT